jgi:CRISPR system Cascade subunit CasE
MTQMWLTRAQLRSDAGLAALGPVLLPEGDDARADMAHRLIWTLFADQPDRTRDFLYREEKPGHFLTLSTRPPLEAGALFRVEPKELKPVLAPGDQLQFRLRANPTVARGNPGARTKRSDVVMDALKPIPPCEREKHRPAIVQREGAAWLQRQGERHGFVVDDVQVDGYRQRRIPRAGAPPIRLAVMEMEGVIEITDPQAFLARLPAGFGRGRAFGCGLMLIRRASHHG